MKSRIHVKLRVVIKLKLNHYILLYLEKFGKSKIPSVRFWALTLLIVSVGLEIDVNGHILTTEDCFKEMDDCANGDCYKKREGDKNSSI